ncbi:MAG: ABC transporter permease, partial [Mangrovimonas sp.]|nr:ABC transporter permease [Mangrovimonas sp.]
EKEGLTRDQFALFKEQLKSDPNIVDVAGKNNGFWFSAAKVNGEQQVNFAYEIVSESYIPMLDIKFVEGRNFSDKHPSDPTHSIIVNESFVKEAGWKNPIGETVDFWYNEGEKYTVIGVVEDYHFYALNQRISSQIFLMKPESSFGEALIKIKPNGATDALNHIAATFKQVFPVNPYSYVFKDDQNKREYEAEAKWKQIMLFSAILTIFISCIGLFGLSVLSAEKRTKEIGIRKVLGASVNHVVTILSKDFIILVVIALVIAVPIAWLVAGQWLQDYPYRIELGWQVFVAAAALVIFIALSTVSFQAIKAAISNPVKSLRTE